MVVSRVGRVHRGSPWGPCLPHTQRSDVRLRSSRQLSKLQLDTTIIRAAGALLACGPWRATQLASRFCCRGGRHRPTRHVPHAPPPRHANLPSTMYGRARISAHAIRTALHRSPASHTADGARQTRGVKLGRSSQRAQRRARTPSRLASRARTGCAASWASAQYAHGPPYAAVGAVVVRVGGVTMPAASRVARCRCAARRSRVKSA